MTDHTRGLGWLIGWWLAGIAGAIALALVGAAVAAWLL